MKLFLISVAIAVSVCGSDWQLFGQGVGNVSATVTFSNGESVSVTDFSNSINVKPNEVVNITIQFTPADVGAMFKVEAVDGGSVSLGSNVVVVGKNRSITFAFRAPSASSRNAVTVQSAPRSFSLQFSVASSGI